MKRFWASLLLCMMLCMGAACSEDVIPEEQFAPMLDFAREQGILDEFKAIYDDAVTGELTLWETLTAWWKEKCLSSCSQVLAQGSVILFPVLLLTLAKAVFPDGSGGAKGLSFLLRMHLLLGFSRVASASLEAAERCLRIVKNFADVASPLLTFLLSAAGLEGTAALVSPAAALAGGAAEDLFIRWGLPLCRLALCTSIAGSLSAQIDLKRFTALMRKTANWGSGLATTLFTGLLALQGSMTESLDGLAVRTAKFAVDSASPVIGSGVSDAWESYISGVMIAKNALGVSGIAGLLLACAAPLLSCLAAMLLLSVTAALLSIFGEKEASQASAQIGGICQMALALCTSALAIGMILLGAAMSAGRSLVL